MARIVMSCLARLLPLAVLCAGPAWGSGAQSGSGVVTTQAVTVAGHEFCQYFAAAWREKEAAEHYTVAVRERPSARHGSEISVIFSNRKVFEGRLPIARATIRQVAQQAADTAYQAIVESETRRKLIGDTDLAPDEF